MRGSQIFSNYPTGTTVLYENIVKLQYIRNFALLQGFESLSLKRSHDK